MNRKGNPFSVSLSLVVGLMMLSLLTGCQQPEPAPSPVLSTPSPSGAVIQPPPSVASLPAVPVAAETAHARETDAKKVIDAMASGKWADLTPFLSDDLKQAAASKAIQQGWSEVVVIHGPLKSQGTPRVTSDGKYVRVFVPCQFAKKTLDTKVVFDQAGKVAGIHTEEHTP